MSITVPPPTVWPVPPGCPPGDLDGLIQCFDDVNSAMAFISAIMIDAVNNNPAVAQAIIAAIQKSGSNVPIIGVTNGTPAISPQVGQYVQLVGTLAYTATPVQANLSLGVLPAGDWDCWLWATFTTAISGAIYSLNPLPPGFAANPAASNFSTIWPATAVLSGMTVEALTSADSLIVADTQVAATSGLSGTMTVNFAARRRR